MEGCGPSEVPDSERRRWMWIAFALGTATRIVLVLIFPTIHGGDAAARLAHADTLILGYQLPLPQAFVILGKALSDDPILVRLLFCVFGGALAAGGAALLSLLGGRQGVRFSALLFGLDPLLIHYSVVPYQESVAYGLLAWAFFQAGRGRERVAAILLAAAFLSRYEVWLFLPLFAWLTQSRVATAIASAPIVAWLMWWQGLAPSGLYVLDIDMHARRLSRVEYLTRKLMEYETAPALVLAAIGMVFVVRHADRRVPTFVGYFSLVIITVVAFGHEYPPGSGHMSERLIHLPVLLSLGLAALALARLSDHSRIALALCTVTILATSVRNVRFEAALLHAAAKEPDLALAREVARALEAAGVHGECVTVIAPSVDSSLLESYVAKVDAAYGDVQAARERARALATSAPDRDRIAAHLRAPTGTVRATSGCGLTVVIDGSSDGGVDGAAATALAEITAGARRARILRTRR